MTRRSGPLPTAEELTAYNHAVPGLGDTIGAKFALQTDHRRTMEDIVIRGNDRRADRGQWMAFIVSMTTIVGGIALAYLGKETAGLVAILGTLGGLAGVFIYGRYKQVKEVSEKARPASE